MSTGKFFAVRDVVTGHVSPVFSKTKTRALKHVLDDRFTITVMSPAELKKYMDENPGANIPNADEEPSASQEPSPQAAEQAPASSGSSDVPFDVGPAGEGSGPHL